MLRPPDVLGDGDGLPVPSACGTSSETCAPTQIRPNDNGESVTELADSTGALVKTLGGSYGFDSPDAPAFDGTHIWVTNICGNSVAELNASSGTWVQTLTGSGYAFNEPDGVALDGTHVWVAKYGSSPTLVTSPLQ